MIFHTPQKLEIFVGDSRRVSIAPQGHNLYKQFFILKLKNPCRPMALPKKVPQHNEDI